MAHQRWAMTTQQIPLSFYRDGNKVAIPVEGYEKGIEIPLKKWLFFKIFGFSSKIIKDKNKI